MTSENNLEDEYENINEEVEGARKNMWLYFYSRSSADNFIVKASDLKEET